MDVAACWMIQLPVRFILLHNTCFVVVARNFRFPFLLNFARKALRSPALIKSMNTDESHDDSSIISFIIHLGSKFKRPIEGAFYRWH